MQILGSGSQVLEPPKTRLVDLPVPIVINMTSAGMYKPDINDDIGDIESRSIIIKRYS